MGYPVLYSLFVMPLPRSLVQLLIFIDYICFACEVVFFYLGLLPRMPMSPWEDEVSFPSTATVKSRLPVIKYRSLKDKSKGAGGSQESTCPVCLTVMEEMDEVRELGNCRHALHKGCIDLWIDAGQLTCPLCRSQLLRSHEKKERGMVIGFLVKLCLHSW